MPQALFRPASCIAQAKRPEFQVNANRRTSAQQPFHAEKYVMLPSLYVDLDEIGRGLGQKRIEGNHLHFHLAEPGRMLAPRKPVVSRVELRAIEFHGPGSTAQRGVMEGHVRETIALAIPAQRRKKTGVGLKRIDVAIHADQVGQKKCVDALVRSNIQDLHARADVLCQKGFLFLPAPTQVMQAEIQQSVGAGGPYATAPYLDFALPKRKMVQPEDGMESG